MSHHFWKPFALAVVALALTAVGPAPLHAQDRPDEHHDQMPAEHHDAEHTTINARRAPTTGAPTLPSSTGTIIRMPRPAAMTASSPRLGIAAAPARSTAESTFGWCSEAIRRHVYNIPTKADTPVSWRPDTKERRRHLCPLRTIV
jgi:hypothetical protein